MNHPTNEEWMSYLYDEADGAEHARLAGHLRGCQECQAKLHQWQTARRHLDGWEIAARAAGMRRGALMRPLLKWAAAVVLFAGIGFAVGRISAPVSASPEQLRAAIEPKMRQELRQEFAQMLRQELDKSASATLAASRLQSRQMLTEYAGKIESARAEDNSILSAALDRLDSQQAEDYVSLKKQLDTVAVLTDAGLRRTENQMVELAGMTTPNQAAKPGKHRAN